MRLSSQMARRLQVTSEKVGNLAFLGIRAILLVN